MLLYAARPHLQLADAGIAVQLALSRVHEFNDVLQVHLDPDFRCTVSMLLMVYCQHSSKLPQALLLCRKVIGPAKRVADCLSQQTVLSPSNRAAVPLQGSSAVAACGSMVAHSMTNYLSSLSAGWVAAWQLHWPMTVMTSIVQSEPITSSPLPLCNLFVLCARAS